MKNLPAVRTKETFQQLFESTGTMFFCPGRINLIGDHIDYNGGWVLPAAISLGTYAMASLNNKNTFSLYSCNFEQSAIQIDLSATSLQQKLKGHWAAYVVGSLLEIEKQTGKKLSGMNIVFNGDIPRGSGLSSSASLEVLTCYLACYLNQISIDKTAISCWAQASENQFVGVNCGIMDQFAVANGEEGKALLLNCNSLNYELIPINLGNKVLVVMNSSKPRQLVESKYNERRMESEEALKQIQSIRNIDKLTEATLEDIQIIRDSLIRKRAHHVVTENRRVIESVEALKKNNLIRFGQLLSESHESLRLNYETSGKEMDQLVAAAQQNKDCLGARIMGGGFGGCALALVKKDGIDQFIQSVEKKYLSTIGYKAEFYLPLLTDGVKELE